MVPSCTKLYQAASHPSYIYIYIYGTTYYSMFTAFLCLEIQVYFWLLRNCCCILGYVQDIKEVLFSASKEESLHALEKYAEREPLPLNTQFGERLPKAGAVQRQLKRKMNITQFYPPGIYGLNFFICAKQLKIEEIFLIYNEKIIFNKRH